MLWAEVASAEWEGRGSARATLKDLVTKRQALRLLQPLLQQALWLFRTILSRALRSSQPPLRQIMWFNQGTNPYKEDERAGPSQGEEEEEEELVNEMETTRSLPLSELQDMQKDFIRRPGEHIVTWLLRCWDSGASSLELEGKEAKQLGSLSREGGIDKAIGKGEPARSLWGRLLSAMKERYPFQEDVVYCPGKWTTMQRSIQ
ncbi:hypothetical protein QYF61_009828 [Mycteria americana]|uniref:Uncharacterized protein n=1 Tax=Mycteria americana TaxID=33587 RepID=A0AAN7N545_MYCAM|nr:hypothetical protein QYF61_009828 [Mycteria americana]